MSYYSEFDFDLVEVRDITIFTMFPGPPEHDETENSSVLNDQDREEPTLDDDDTQSVRESWNTDKDGIDKKPINPEDENEQ